MAKLLLPRPSTPMIDVKTGIVTSEWRKWFESGGAILSGDAQLPSTSLPTSSQSGTGAGLLYTGSDGDIIKYGGTFGQVPERIEVDVSDLPSLEAGKAYDCKAINITAKQFELYAKVTTSEAISLKTTTGNNIGNVTPKYRFKKPIVDDAYNGIYEFYFTPKLYKDYSQSYNYAYNRYRYTIDDTDVGVYIGQYDIYIYSGGWVKITMLDLMEDAGIGYNGAFLTMPNYKASIETTLPIGLNNGDYEFGIEPLGSSQILEVNEVQYETKTVSSVESLGSKKLKCYVYA